MDATTRREWTRATRDYNRAMDALNHAIERLNVEAGIVQDTTDDWQELQRIEAALGVLQAASRRVNDHYTETRKRLNVKVYRPYGR